MAKRAHLTTNEVLEEVLNDQDCDLDVGECIEEAELECDRDEPCLASDEGVLRPRGLRRTRR